MVPYTVRSRTGPSRDRATVKRLTGPSGQPPVGATRSHHRRYPSPRARLGLGAPPPSPPDADTGAATARSLRLCIRALCIRIRTRRISGRISRRELRLQHAEGPPCRAALPGELGCRLG
eukprot:scaffold15288_cov58-Phaeocystis_antarctica.AAC.2